jgi:fumarate reductase flavoprotein subunit
MIVGEFIADFCDRPENDLDVPTGLVREFMTREQSRLDGLLLGSGREDASAIRAEMQEIMTGKVGIFRRGSDLEQAVDQLQKLLTRSRRIGLRSRWTGAIRFRVPRRHLRQLRDDDQRPARPRLPHAHQQRRP